MRTWPLMLGLSLLPIAGCNSAVDYKENSGWNTAATYTAADTRIVTQRPHPLFNGRQVICTEPSPDVAKALSTARQLTASGGNGTVSGSLAASAATASAVAELAGRSTALLGLRDGLYRACEAYANGALGDSAYALVLSRYGQIMITLFLGQDAAGAGPAGTGWAHAEGPSLQFPGASMPPKAGAGGAGASAGPAAAKASPQRPALQAAAWLPATPIADDASHPAPATHGTNADSPAKQPTSRQASTASPADAVARMQQAYFDLNKDSLSILLVACVNEADPTRPGAFARQAGSANQVYLNQFLMRPGGVCDQVTQLAVDAAHADLDAARATRRAGAGRAASSARRH